MENFSEDQLNHIKGALEALFFVSETPLTLDQISKALDTISKSDLKNIINLYKTELEEAKRGVIIVEIAGGYKMLTNSIYACYMRNFYKTKHKEKLSKPALESLAIIAYKQPVARSDIELIRGVNSDGVVTHLLNKELIKVVGRKEIPGKPFIYGTTKQFLDYFGLKSLDDLPNLEEFPKIIKQREDYIDSDRQEDTFGETDDNVMDDTGSEFVNQGLEVESNDEAQATVEMQVNASLLEKDEFEQESVDNFQPNNMESENVDLREMIDKQEQRYQLDNKDLEEKVNKNEVENIADKVSDQLLNEQSSESEKVSENHDSKEKLEQNELEGSEKKN